tara:strand:- start:2568 stop:3563 length:996 start_codon:yes stop_codon:yes gene_type:complete
MERLKRIAKKMVANNKGILAADESTPTCTKRFEKHQVESTSITRNNYRSTLFSAIELENYISGIILFEETFHQKLMNSDIPIPLFLKEKGILTGIKVDTGAKLLANHNHEKITEGLDGLRERLQVYKQKGADFAKWRAVITIGEQIPSKGCINANAHALARYASLCQENGLVPIVEPEVLMNGNHTIQQCYQISDLVLNNVFEQLQLLNVDLESIVLKPNMILPGTGSQTKISNQEIADMTYQVLKKNVPKEVPGIAFLSGGQSSDLAAERLNLLNSTYIHERPWKLTFSYGRALQEDALFAWSQGDNSKTQHALINRAKMNYLASHGKLQ